MKNLANIVLAGFKAFVGFLANSIAIISDAVNNLSDALSSIIKGQPFSPDIAIEH
jgi:divalent metal cation (Fe/Co/Zn/Cd) transporter